MKPDTAEVWTADGDAATWTEECGYGMNWVDTPCGRWTCEQPSTGAQHAHQAETARRIAGLPSDLARLRGANKELNLRADEDSETIHRTLAELSRLRGELWELRAADEINGRALAEQYQQISHLHTQIAERDALLAANESLAKDAERMRGVVIADIEPSDGLDRITYILRDFGEGRGQLIVACYGKAWSAYWGAMSNRDIRQFLIDCDAGYIATKLKPGDRYVLRIVTAIKSALAASASAKEGDKSAADAWRGK